MVREDLSTELLLKELFDKIARRKMVIGFSAGVESEVKVLRSFGYRPVDHTGSHVKLRYEHPANEEIRIVSVPLHDRGRTGTLQQIAEQRGAKDFHA